jgi:hypothetical protein
MKIRVRSLAAVAALLIVPSLAAGCAKREAPPAAASTAAAPAAESPRLGLRLAELPAGISSPNELGSAFTLKAELGGADGLATLRVLERGASAVNLVEEAKAFGASAAAQGGKFFGGNELVTPTGAAYAARALVDQATAEEQRVFMLHPDGSERLLTVTLRYAPAGDEVTRARMQQLLALVAALEPLPKAAG